MKKLLLHVFLIVMIPAFGQAVKQFDEGEEMVIKSIYSKALLEQQAYKWLDQLCNEIGSRLAGSANDKKAVIWAVEELSSIGLDSVWTQEVEVPKWVRGKEEASIKEFVKEYPLAITALGGSVPTRGVLLAEVVEVHNFDELAALGKEKIEGKIVFYNRSMDPTLISTGAAYGGAANQRWAGAKEASKFGAVAVLVRSLTLKPDNYPHTGSMSYGDAKVKIPAAAVSIEGAEMLSKKLKENTGLKVQMNLTCSNQGKAISYNVIGEIKGRDKPNEIVVVGGHLDSWDLGTGAQDDGAGATQSMETIKILKEMDYELKRTHRIVLFANEEFGLDGAKAYAKQVKERGEYHAIALESDGGSGTPRGFSVQAVEDGVNYVWGFEELLSPYGLNQFMKGWSGADIGQLKSDKTILIGYVPDNQRYFDYHHAYTDRFDIINARELELGAASMAALLYLMDKYQISL